MHQKTRLLFEEEWNHELLKLLRGTLDLIKFSQRVYTKITTNSTVPKESFYILSDLKCWPAAENEV